MMFRSFAHSVLAVSIVATSTFPAHADSYVFRYKQTLSDTPNPIDPEVPVDPGYGIGNDITVFFTGAIGYEFSKVIPVATKDVVEWRRSKGSYQPGLTLDPDAGVISGVAAGTTDARNVVLLGYDIGGNAIARANITFNFRNPVGVPQNIVFYGHTDKYLFREIKSAGNVNVARWESLTPLPDDLHTEGRYLVGTPTNPYNTSVAFVGYDYMDKEVAFSAGDLIVQDGPTFNTVADKHQHPEDEFYAYGKVQHKLGELQYRLIALDGKPSSLGFNSDGELEGYIRTFNTSLRFQIEAMDIDGTIGKSNIFTFSTFAPDVDISDMKDLQGAVGTQYSLKLTGEDLSGDMNWQVVAGKLPSGLELDPDTGVISGIPMTEEIEEGIVISVTTSDNGFGQTKPFSFKIHPEQVVVSFKETAVRTNESFTTNGPSFDKGLIDPHSFSLADGASVAQSLTVDYPNAKVSGSASTAGDYSVPFNFTNGDGRQSVFVQPIGVYNPLDLSYDNIVTVYRRVAANAMPIVADQSVIGEPQFSLNTGTLPDGLRIQPQSGAIYGTPRIMGNLPGISVSLADASGERTISNTFSIEVADRPAVELAVGAVDIQRFVHNVVQVATAKNAFDGIDYELVAGQLPTGLSLDVDGRIVGSTQEPEGTYPGFQVKATDGEGYSALSPVFSISIVAPKNLNALKETATSASWTVGVPFSLSLPRPDNAYGTVTYDLQDLPSGVSVIGDKLVGTVNDLGSMTFPMTLTDEGHRTLSGTFTLDILEPMTASLSGASAQVSTFSFLRMATAARFNLPRGSETTINAQITNGIEPVQYTFQGSLPAGMTYADGIVYGTPIVENQTGSIALTVTDAAGTSIQLPANLSVIARLPVAPSYDFSKPIYLNSFQTLPRKPLVKNAIGAVSYSVSGTLPEGLKFDEKTGYFSGAPRQDGRFPGIVVTAVDSEGQSYAGSYGPFEIGVSRIGEVGIAAVSNFTVRAAESFLKMLSASNVTRPLTFTTKDGGPMPHGLILGSVDGSISGTFPAEGKYYASVKVTDDFGRSRSTIASFTVVGALSIAPPPTLSFNQHATVDALPITANVVGAARYELVSGTLPAGLSLNPSTGAIRGTPTVKGTAAGLIVRVTDSTGASKQTVPFTLTITDRLPLTMNTATSYAVFANLNYRLTMPITNAVGNVTYTQTGALPAGITFDASKGIFSGKATVIGTFSGITVTATDSAGGTVTKTFSFVVSTNGSPIALTVTNFVTKVGRPILTTKPTWSNHVGDVRLWADDTLAQYGLTIDPLTGIISGTATQLMDFTPNVHITDGSDRVTSKPINIKVIPNLAVSGPARIERVALVPFTGASFTADNVVGTGTWTYEGTLPAGVIFEAPYGRFSGSPSEVGIFTGVMKYTDSLGDVGSAPVTIDVASNGLPPLIAFTPAATGYTAISATTLSLSHTRKKTGDIVALAPGSNPLPPGMTLAQNASGAWELRKGAGTQADIGVYRGINLRATDVGGLYSETGPMTFLYTSSPGLTYPAVAFSSRATVPVAIDPPTPSAGKATADIQFAFTSKATGGQNLTIDPTTGAIGGHITASGTNVVTVTESYDGIIIRKVTYNVTFTKLDLSMTTESFSVIAGQDYASEVVAFANGIPSGSFTVEGALPAGLSFDGSRLQFVGTTEETGSWPVTLRYADPYGSISAALTIHSSSADVGHRYWRMMYYKLSSTGTMAVYELDLLDSSGGNLMALASKTGQGSVYDNDPTTSHSAGLGVQGPFYVTTTFPDRVKPATANLRLRNNVGVRITYQWSDDGTTWNDAVQITPNVDPVGTITTAIP